MYHFCFHGIHPFVCAGRYGGIALRKAGERLDLLREAFRGRTLGRVSFYLVQNVGAILQEDHAEWVGAFPGAHGL